MISPVSSNTITPLQSRLQPCSGNVATTRAASWSTASAGGHGGWCWHIFKSPGWGLFRCYPHGQGFDSHDQRRTLPRGTPHFRANIAECYSDSAVRMTRIGPVGVKRTATLRNLAPGGGLMHARGLVELSRLEWRIGDPGDPAELVQAVAAGHGLPARD